ncbi:BTB/POZ domain-containing protein 6 [Trachymyrmex septentrionalis]|uniref:BTB/POZ domain-containing protein 6 n=1 Tax=Trachymyrmex septentrionalis TaxID=34720 RepID=A0A195EVE3_9HYME|nr:BTB/POZ domain-containing protein 6 [Trachymyrmex septentrionalis]
MEKLRAFVLREKRGKKQSDSNRDTYLLIDNVAYAKTKKSRISGGNSQFSRIQTKSWREKSQGLQCKIYSRILISPLTTKTSYKNFADMSRIPLMEPETGLPVTEGQNIVILEAGLPGDSWTYSVERERLARRSEWCRAMLTGSFAPPLTDSPPLLRLEYVDKRAFDHFLKYLHDEPVNFISVTTARVTLDAAHQYLCPGLARLAVVYLENHLTPSTVLEIYQGLGLYANELQEGDSNFDRSSNLPPTPSAPGDDASVIAAMCTDLLLKCLTVIDSNPVKVLHQEYFEELSVQEVAQLAYRDTLNITSESILFNALDRWAAAECRRQGIEPLPVNKRTVLSDDVCFSVRYLLMNDREFVSGPMASGILTNEECVHIVSKILRHPEDPKNESVSMQDNKAYGKLSLKNLQIRSSAAVHPSRLSNAPRIAYKRENQDCNMLRPGKKERQDNRKNRRRECASQGHRACARIGNCLVRILACVFD